MNQYSRLFLISIGYLLSNAGIAAPMDCVSKSRFIEHEHSGMYHRVSPDGKYVLYSSSGSAHLVDVSVNPPRKMWTPLESESFACEGNDSKNWNLLASPLNGGVGGPGSGTEYYSIKDIVSESPHGIVPKYTDANHGQYYLSCSEVSRKSTNQKTYRTLLYSDMEYRDYQFKFKGNGEIEDVQAGEIKQLCRNIFKKREFSIDANLKRTSANNKVESLYKIVESLNEISIKKNTSKAKRKEIQKKIAKLHDDIQKIKLASDNEFYGEEYARLMKQSSELESENSRIRGLIEQKPKFLMYMKRLGELAEMVQKISLRIANDPVYIKFTKRIEARYKAIVKTHKDYYNEPIYASLRNQHQEFVDKMQKELGFNELMEDYNRIEVEKSKYVDGLPESKIIEKNGRKIEELGYLIGEQRLGKKLYNPIQSKDGRFVAGLVLDKLQIFKVNKDGDCTLYRDLGIRGSKASFNFPKNDDDLKITFTASGGYFDGFKRGVFVYDARSESYTKVSDDEKSGEVSYPNFTYDGRIVYSNGSGFYFVDPKQFAENSSDCIKEKDLISNKKTHELKEISK